MAAVGTRIASDHDGAAFYDMCDKFGIEGAELMALLSVGEILRGSGIRDGLRASSEAPEPRRYFHALP